MNTAGLTNGQLAVRLYALGYTASRDEALLWVLEDPASVDVLLTAYHGPEMKNAADVATEFEWGNGNPTGEGL